jgi:hypothetical protein
MTVLSSMWTRTRSAVLIRRGLVKRRAERLGLAEVQHWVARDVEEGAVGDQDAVAGDDMTSIELSVVAEEVLALLISLEVPESKSISRSLVWGLDLTSSDGQRA